MLWLWKQWKNRNFPHYAFSSGSGFFSVLFAPTRLPQGKGFSFISAYLCTFVSTTITTKITETKIFMCLMENINTESEKEGSREQCK